MDPNSGRLHKIESDAEARLRGLVRVERELSDEEKASGKIGFNAPCACGSGKKFKRCCYGKHFFTRRFGA